MIVLFSILFSNSDCVIIVLYLLAHTDSFHEKGAILPYGYLLTSSDYAIFNTHRRLVGV
jgi:hypothetical protein